MKAIVFPNNEVELYVLPDNSGEIPYKYSPTSLLPISLDTDEFQYIMSIFNLNAVSNFARKREVVNNAIIFKKILEKHHKHSAHE